MKTLIISKPVYDYILPLVEFPLDGDNFYINQSIKTTNNIGIITAITLAKYGINVSYTGMIGEDEIGRKIQETLESYNIDTKYIEKSYTEHTCTNYKIYNEKTKKYTTITEKSLKTNLTKHKYDFIPDVVIMDDGDYEANLAAINNYPNSNLIYVGDNFTKDSLIYCNKCKYIITSLKFASDVTGITSNLNKTQNIVSLFQKFIDLYHANLIIKLDNFDILYCINDEVRLIKNVNKNTNNKGNLYNSLLIYFLINTNDIENSIKMTNKTLLNITDELDMLKNIPDYKVIMEIMNSSNNNINNTNTIITEQETTNLQNINTNPENIDNKILETPILNNKEGNNIEEL